MRRIAMLTVFAGFQICLQLWLQLWVSAPAFAQSEAIMEAEADRAQGLNSATPTTASINTSAEGLSKARLWFNEARRNFSSGFFNFATAPMKYTNLGGGQVFTYNYLSLEYRLGRQQKISFRPVFMYAFAGTDDRGFYRDESFQWGDAFINYTHYDLFNLPFDFDVISQLKVYAPTGNSSRDRGMLTRIRPYFIASRVMAPRWSLNLHFQPDYYINERTSYLNERGFVYTNRHYGYEAFAEVNYRINRYFAAAGSFGHDQMWSHPSVANGQSEFRNEELRADASVSVFYKGLISAVGVSQKHDVLRPRRGLRVFHDEETSYYVRSFYRF
ncbi:MAG TPA: hypothetical protein PLZ57_11775 [Pseudobdellovibrionaceae bacterium]|nr:hypothetical protein [Pseudobdellovibrionaceae bacterium]